MEDDGLRIGGLDRVDHAEGAALGERLAGVAHEVDGGFDVGGGDGRPSWKRMPLRRWKM